MNKYYKIENFIVFLIVIKLGLSLLTLQSRGNKIATVSFGAPVYAQEGKTAADEKIPEGKKDVRQTASGEIDIEILKSIEQKEEGLKKREEAIKKREEQLSLLTAEVEKKLSDIKEAQSKIESMVTMREDLIEKSIKHLVKVYSAMKPAQAGPLIEKLDKDITIQILSKMKGKDAGKILANVKPALAAQLSEEIAKRK